MKIWRFIDPNNYDFAQAGRHGGTFQEGEPWERLNPLTIEWEPGSNVVGDFVWVGLSTDIAVTDRVVVALRESEVRGFEPREVRMFEPKSALRRSRKRMVRLPYDGPPLFDLWVTQWVDMDRDRSTFRIDDQSRVRILDVETTESDWDPVRKIRTLTRVPRIEARGLFVKSAAGIFRVREAPAWILCSDDVKRTIEDHGFTNVSFWEMGDILDRDANVNDPDRR